jgi:hypothetical protein
MTWGNSEEPQEPLLSSANRDLGLRDDLLPNFPLQRTGARGARPGR